MITYRKYKREENFRMSKEQSAIKICKYCQTEIPSGAKVCPQCRKKQGGKLKWFIIAILIVAVIGAAAGGGGNDKPEKIGNADGNTESNKDSSENKVDDEKETIFKKGEIAELNGVQVTLMDYKENAGSEYNKPSDGNVFLMAEFEIVNNTKEELGISSMLSFEAYADDYKLDYSLAAIMEKEGNQLDGEIAAGKKMKGGIGWEVPQDYQAVEVHFTDNVWSSNKFMFLIEK